MFALQNHTRNAGRLILLSGATGKMVGRYLEMPESKETYMSPVMHRRKDGSMYILFGHGGETVTGRYLCTSTRQQYFAFLFRKTCFTCQIISQGWFLEISFI